MFCKVCQFHTRRYLKISTLTTSWVAQSSCAQRAGRAGRVRRGLCFHLFSKKRFEMMDAFRPPELLRSPLEDVCLHVKLLLEQTQEAGTIASFLQEAPDPPEALSVPHLAWVCRYFSYWCTGIPVRDFPVSGISKIPAHFLGSFFF